MTANERRNAILEVLCLRRFETVENLAFEFGVSGRTIRNDVLILSCEYPIYTAKGNGGGIRVDGNYRFMAAMWLHDQGKMEKVHCMYGGRTDLLDYLTGNTEEQPLE